MGAKAPNVKQSDQFYRILATTNGETRNHKAAPAGLLLGPLDAVLGRSQDTELRRYVVDSVVRVDVLSQDKLVAGGTGLSGGDRGRSQEVLPDSEPLDTVLVDGLILVAHPVSVPLPQGRGVGNTNVVKGDNLEASRLQRADNKGQWGGSVRTRENVLVHEQAPHQVLVLPAFSQTRVLQEEDTIVLQGLVDLSQEGAETLDAHMLGHFKTGDLVILAAGLLGRGRVSVVAAHDFGLGGVHAVLGQEGVTPLGLVSAQGDTGELGTELGGAEGGPGTPATAQVQDVVDLGQLDLGGHGVQLVVLQLLQGLFLGDVADNTGGVDHAGTQEPGVEIVTSVVVVSDLLLVLRTRVHDHLRDEAQQEEAEKRQGEAEVGPIVSVLHHVQAVALEGDLAVKVQLVEGLHGDLGALATVGFLVLGLQFRGVELQVVRHGFPGQLDLLVEAGREQRQERPVGHQDGHREQQEEDHPGFEAETQLAGHQERDHHQKPGQRGVGEVLASGTVSGQGSIGNCGRVGGQNTAFGGRRSRRLGHRRLNEFDVVQHGEEEKVEKPAQFMNAGLASGEMRLPHTVDSARRTFAERERRQKWVGRELHCRIRAGEGLECGDQGGGGAERRSLCWLGADLGRGCAGVFY